jgi:hypothetical protein
MSSLMSGNCAPIPASRQRTLFHTSSLKIPSSGTLIENSTPDDRSYIEVLGALLAHDILTHWPRQAPSPAAGARRSRRLAEAGGRFLYRGTSRRTRSARRAGATCSLEPLPFLSSFQAVLWHAAASISHDATDRTGQDTLGEAVAFYHRHCSRLRFQSNEFVQCVFSQGDGADADRLYRTLIITCIDSCRDSGRRHQAVRRVASTHCGRSGAGGRRPENMTFERRGVSCQTYPSRGCRYAAKCRRIETSP